MCMFVLVADAQESDDTLRQMEATTHTRFHYNIEIFGCTALDYCRLEEAA